MFEWQSAPLQSPATRQSGGTRVLIFVHLSRVLARLPPACTQLPRFPLTSFFSSAYRLRVSNSNSGNGSIHIAASSFSIAISRFVPTIRVILLARQGSGTACWLSNRSRPLNPPPAVPPSPTAVHTRRWRRRHRVSLGTPARTIPEFTLFVRALLPNTKKNTWCLECRGHHNECDIISPAAHPLFSSTNVV
jgi:hypothetical protein